MKKLIFDLDNTLLFLSEDWAINYQKFIDKYNLNIKPEDLYYAIGTFEKNNSGVLVDIDYFLNYVNSKLSINVKEEEQLIDLLNLYADIPLLYTDTIYDILDYLSKKYELISYTNWFTNNQINRLKKYNLDKFFTKVYGWDLLPTKPSKEGLLEIVKYNNISDYTFIGDSIEYDMEMPNNIGMNTIFYNRKGIVQDKYKEIKNIEELKNVL